MNCENISNLMHGYLDNELDLPATLAVEAHLQACLVCQETFQKLSRLRNGIRREMSYHAAPDALRARLQQPNGKITATRHDENWIKSLLASLPLPKQAAAIAALILAIGLGWQINQLSSLQQLSDAVVANHVRSLMADHLTDVASSDQHAVKPWFNGKLDFSPQVLDLTEQGFPLVGGRLDYLHTRAVTALIYRRRQHIINVFIWPEILNETPADYSSARNGYNLLAFKTHGMNYWIVSDLNTKELMDLKKLLYLP